MEPGDHRGPDTLIFLVPEDAQPPIADRLFEMVAGPFGAGIIDRDHVVGDLKGAFHHIHDEIAHAETRDDDRDFLAWKRAVFRRHLSNNRGKGGCGTPPEESSSGGRACGSG